MGSASAKWAIMAPVFIPMFMLLGYSPELTQAAYRVGDSTTNIVSPMMSYFALIVAFVERYSPRAGIGTVISLMLPYTVTFLAIRMVLLGCGWRSGFRPGQGLRCICREGAILRQNDRFDFGSISVRSWFDLGSFSVRFID
jgi:aminobenzoyl-glutamate transport protein